MRRLTVLLALALTACGAEVAGTAATAAAGRAEEARQAEQAREQVRQQLDAAAQLQQQRLQEAERTLQQ